MNLFVEDGEYIVPADVTRIKVTAKGSDGSGSNGQIVVTYLHVEEGQRLAIKVGGPNGYITIEPAPLGRGGPDD